MDRQPHSREGAAQREAEVPDALEEAHQERILVQGCRDGDEHAMRRLYEREVGGVNRKLVAVLGPDPEVDDLIQMTFVRAFRSLRDFRGDARLSTWLYRIALNLAYGHLASARRKRWLQALDPTKLRLADPNPRAEALFEQKQRVEILYEVLSRVKPKNRIAFVLTEIEGHTIDDAATMLGISRNTVAARVRRTRDHVRAALALRERRKATETAQHAETRS